MEQITYMTPRSSSSSRHKAVRPPNRPSEPVPALRTVPATSTQNDLDQTTEDELQAEMNRLQALLEKKREQEAARKAAEAARAAEAAKAAEAAQKEQTVVELLKTAGIPVDSPEQVKALARAFRLMRYAEIDEQDDQDIETPEQTYPGTGTDRKHKEILALADALGVITVQDVIDNVKQDDGRPQTYAPARRHLKNLVDNGQLHMRSDRTPRPTRLAAAHPRQRYIYARTQALLDEYQRGRPARA